MKKIAMSVAAVMMLVGGLTACGTANDGVGMKSRNYQGQTVNPYGVNNYSSNYGTNPDTFTNARSRYRGQGPVTDMLTPDGRYRGATYSNFNRSGSFTDNFNGMSGRRDGYGGNYHYGMRNRGITGNNYPGMVGQDGILGRDGYQFNGGVTGNYDGRSFYNARNNNNMQNHLNNQHRAMNYHQDYDSQTAQKIANDVMQIKGVDDVRVIVNKNDVVVGVDTHQNVSHVQKEVEHKVKSLAKGKKVHVSTDRDVVDRIRTMDDRLRTGTPFQEVGNTFTDMVRDIGAAVTRPFR